MFHYRSIVAIFLVILAACAFADQPSPSPTQSNGTKSRPIFNPDNTPNKYIMAIVDVETTGLNPEYHEMIDIGAIYVDLNGKELGRFYTKIMPPHPERISQGARAVNGFDVNIWKNKGAITEAIAVKKFLAFHRKHAKGKVVLFTAFNVWFDQAFLTELLARNKASWRDCYYYQVLDIPSMAWGAGYKQLRGAALSKALQVEDETHVPLEHTGITGAEFNLRLIRALFRKQNKES
ncbi:MAG: exonuclease domain-containing protein [Gemmataceae bacterium]